MKKLVSLIFAAAAVLALSVCAFAAENIDKLFVLNAASGAPASEAAAYAGENGFDGILFDCRSGCSESYMTELFSAAGGKRLFALCHADFSATLAAQNFEYVLVPAGEATEENLAALGKKAGLFLPFGGDEALEKAGELYSAGGFNVIFAENFHSSYSETNYEAYLKKLKKSFPDAKLYTVNDLSRVLTPVSRGDFFGDAYELNNQYLVNVLRKTGFCVYDYAALKSDANGSASYLVNAFGSTVLDKYADFSISKKFAITRPTTSALTVETYKYTIFGTSDPGKKLYMDGVEIKRIGTSGLFAVTVDAPKKGATYTFTQGDAVRSVTINRGTATGGSGKTSRLSSIAPAASLSARPGEAVTITCIGPAGGAVYAEVAGKSVTLTQVAAADTGVPAKFKAEVVIPEEKFVAGEVTSLGQISYTLVYNGETKNYKSAGEVFAIGDGAKLAIRANCNLAGIEPQPETTGSFTATLRTGCADYVVEETEDWYGLSMGGYIKKAHSTPVTGGGDVQNSITSVRREAGENYELLHLSCTNIPAFRGEIDGKKLRLTLYNTSFGEFGSIDKESELFYIVNPIDNGDGTITVVVLAKHTLWGWDIQTDEETGTMTVVLKKQPVLSGNLDKPLSGITVAVCSGHGGPDPGALSPAGDYGVNEAEINLANTMSIAESLERLGAKIVLLVSDGSKLDTYGRTDPAREAFADVYICCHANSVAENADANLWCGTEVYYHYDESAKFSQKLADYISSATRRDNEGSKQDYYSVTRLTLCPAVMLEVGFISNPAEVESLIDKTDIQKTALAVTKAVMEILDN